MLKKKNFIAIVFIVVITVLFAAAGVSATTNQATDDFTDAGVGSPKLISPAPPLVNLTATGPVIYDNGPLINSSGTGVGGADESILQSSLGMVTFGWGHEIANNNLIADDFVVTGLGMDIESITFYAYQTGSSTTSTITAYNVSIYDANPGTAGAAVVAASSTINSSVWSNIYRVNESGAGNNT